MPIAPPRVENRSVVPRVMREFMLQSVKRWDIQDGILRDVAWRALKEDVGNKPHEVHWQLHLAFEKAQWFRIYDFIELLYGRLANPTPIELLGQFTQTVLYTAAADGFASDVNDCLIENGIPWRFEKGAIVMRGDDTFQHVVAKAVSELEVAERPTAAGHIRSAVKAISDRPKANTSGAVSHSTSAMECVFNATTGEKLQGLGKYLDKSALHGSLKKALHGLYGYACDAGARHGQEGIEPDLLEAQFVVQTCAAACALLNATNLKADDER